MNANPTVPWTEREPVMTGTWGRTVRIRVAAVEVWALLAAIVTKLVPDEMGMPEMTPVEAFTLNPEGRSVAL